MMSDEDEMADFIDDGEHGRRKARKRRSTAAAAHGLSARAMQVGMPAGGTCLALQVAAPHAAMHRHQALPSPPVHAD
jgi:hypothetical protein